jgi:hypothetical protein
MRARSVPVVALTLALACDPKPAGGADSKEAPSETAKETAEKTAEAPEREPKAPAPASTQNTVPTEDATVPSEDTAPASFTIAAGIAAPAKAEARAAIEAALASKPTLLAPPVEFGARRYAFAVHTKSGEEDDPTFTVHALVLEAAGDDAAWSVAGELELAKMEQEILREVAGRIPTTIKADDYDDDGEAELIVRMREIVMCGGGGPNEITTMRIVDFGPTPRLALDTELAHSLLSGAAETKAKVVHEDLNADRHRDVRIRYTTQAVDEADEQGAENRWLWDAAADEWRRAPTAGDAELPAYDKWGCDW